MNVHVVSQFHDRPQNSVIVSKLPMDSGWYELWKETPPTTPPRGFAFAALRLPDDHFLLVYTVHYKSNNGTPESNFAMRQQASRQLLEHADAMLKVYSRRGKCSLLIGGDLLFINFGTRRRDFTAIVRCSNVHSVSAVAPGRDLAESLPVRRVEIRGRIELFKGNPQIELTRSNQLRFL